MKIRVGLRTIMAENFRADIAKGTAAAPKIEVYEGVMPANMGGAIAGNLLTDFELTNAVGTVTDGVLTFDSISPDAAAAATGTAGFGRILDRDGAEITYLTVSQTGGSGEIQLSSVNIVGGEPVTLTSGIIRAGA